VIRWSLIVSTEAEQSDAVTLLLRHIRHVTRPPDEIIVVSQGELVLPPEMPQVRLLCRPHDSCRARSRNLGAAAATASHLLFLDAGVLPHPACLERITPWFEATPELALYGYFGNSRDHCAPSRWFPDCTVHYLDHRYVRYGHTLLEPHPALLTYPHWFAWGDCLALSRSALELAGGYDERYLGRGGEDPALALRLMAAGVPRYFSPDLWADTLIAHSRHYSGDPPGRFFHLNRFPGPAQLQCQMAYLPELLTALLGHYLPQDTSLDAAFRQLLPYPTTEFSLSLRLDTKELHCHAHSLGAYA
jgi:hypothetical protein